MWLFLDIIIVAIFVILAISGAKRGLIKSVLGIGVVIVSILITMNFYTGNNLIVQEEINYYYGG